MPRKPPDKRPSFNIPDDTFQPEQFGIRGISDGENGFVVLVVEGSQTLIFDLEAAQGLANAINHAIDKVTEGLRDREDGPTGPTVRTA